MPAFLDQTVLALDAANDGSRVQKQSGKDGRILVVVQLAEPAANVVQGLPAQPVAVLPADAAAGHQAHRAQHG